MSDHYHYDYAETRHDHSEYAAERHDHDYDYAEKYHRHYDDESTAQGLREDLGRAESRIGELESEMDRALGRITVLEERLHERFAGGGLHHVRSRRVQNVYRASPACAKHSRSLFHARLHHGVTLRSRENA